MSRLRDLHAKEPFSPPPLLQKRLSGKISPARRLGSTGFEPEKTYLRTHIPAFRGYRRRLHQIATSKFLTSLNFLLLAALLCAFHGNFPCGALTSRCACAFSRFLAATKPRPLFRILQYTKGEIGNSCVSFHAVKTCFPSGKVLNFHPAALLGLRGVYWSYRTESNRRPAHYKCAALPTELQ